MRTAITVVIGIACATGASASLHITEILATTNSAHPDDDRESPDARRGFDQFVEIYNSSESSTVDLSGWRLADSDGMTAPFPPGTIVEPLSTLVLIGAPPAGAPTIDAALEFERAWGTGYEVVAVDGWYEESGLGGLALDPAPGAERLRLLIQGQFESAVATFDDEHLWPRDASGAIDEDAWSIYAFETASLINGASYSKADPNEWTSSAPGADGGRFNRVSRTVNGFLFASPGVVAGLAEPTITYDGLTDCAPDLNGDGLIDGADLGLLLGAWGSPTGDFNGDGDTDGADLGLLMSSWGVCA